MLVRKNYPWYLFCLAYILGLFCTGISFNNPNLNLNHLWQGVILSFGAILLCLTVSIIVSRYFSLKIKLHWWLIASLVIIASFYYYQWRLPHPSSTDITHQLLTKIQKPSTTPVNLTGKILTPPKINRNYRAKFELQALELSHNSQSPIPVTGKVYVTAPLLSASNLYPTQVITIKGKLYQPFPQQNPSGFDFSNYLALRGIFTGFNGDEIQIISEGNPFAKFRLQLRQRVIKTHLRYLNTEAGTLVSSIAIGNRVVDLPYHILDSFQKTGLAHVIAASGFHVSLLLTVILVLTKSQSPQIKFICGLISLLIYLCLTGFYPSVLRAGLMGVAVLIGIITEQRIKVSASLLLVATILLLINPLWIWDLGFQFSFLATWGLIANLSPVVKSLDWMPPNLANLIAVPLVATIWILPLQCYVFKGFSLYCIFANILTTFPIIVINLGGMITGLIGIFSPLIGSYLTTLLIPFIWLMINSVNWMVKLPLSWLAVGKIPLIFILLCYGFLFLVNVSTWWQKRWFKFSLCLLTLIVIPLIYQKLNLVQITVLKTHPQPSIVIQNYWQTGVININNKNTVTFNLIPFLNSQAVNQVKFVYTANNDPQQELGIKYLSNLLKIQQILSSDNFNTLNITDNFQLDKIADNENILSLQFHDLNWLIINTQKPITLANNLTTDVLIYTGHNLSLTQLQQLQPQVAIAFSNFTSPQHLEYFTQQEIKFFEIQTEGAIQWQPQTGFRAFGANYDKM